MAGHLDGRSGRPDTRGDASERRRLVAGTAPAPEQRARYRAAGLWSLPLLALGVARVVAGTANGRPVGFLVVLLVVTVVLAVALCLRVPNATELGRRTLDRLRAEAGRPAALPPPSWPWPRPCSAPGSCGAPTSRWPWPCGFPREQSAFLGGAGAGADGGGGGGGGGGSCGGGGCCGGGGGCGGGCGG